PRGGPRDRQCLPAAAAAAAAGRVRLAVRTLPGVLHAEAVQQELRAAPRRVVRAEPPRRGFRRDVRRVAVAGKRVAAALRGVAGAAKARIHGPADVVAPPPAAAARE